VKLGQYYSHKKHKKSQKLTRGLSRGIRGAARGASWDIADVTFSLPVIRKERFFTTENTEGYNFLNLKRGNPSLSFLTLKLSNKVSGRGVRGENFFKKGLSPRYFSVYSQAGSLCYLLMQSQPGLV